MASVSRTKFKQLTQPSGPPASTGTGPGSGPDGGVDPAYSIGFYTSMIVVGIFMAQSPVEILPAINGWHPTPHAWKTVVVIATVVVVIVGLLMIVRAGVILWRRSQGRKE